jgi:hypothetical protein
MAIFGKSIGRMGPKGQVSEWKFHDTGNIWLVAAIVAGVVFIVFPR